MITFKMINNQQTNPARSKRSQNNHPTSILTSSSLDELERRKLIPQTLKICRHQPETKSPQRGPRGDEVKAACCSDTDSLLEGQNNNNNNHNNNNKMFNPQSIGSTSASDSMISPAPSMSSPSTTLNSVSLAATSGGGRKRPKLHGCALVPPRLVSKNGNVNLFLENISRRKYVRDLFTTMIDIKWRYNLMFAAFGFVFSWILFASVWYLVLYFHDDLAHENDPNWSPCIVNVHSFPAALLFSIETQSTLGFGSRIISVECPGAIVIFCIQLIFGVVVECLIVGMVFAKLSRPAKRSQTIMFSKFATICLREGKMCLTFRVGDVRSKSHIIGATIRASLVSHETTKEGELIPFYHHQLDVKIDNSKNNLLLIWPVTIVHAIDEDSLLFQLSKEQLENSKFEIITVLEGTVESTGQPIQVRSSYLPNELKWGYRFESIVSTHGFGRHAQTVIDYKKFNSIIQVDTPTCSPEEFYKSGFSPTSLMFSSSTASATSSSSPTSTSSPASFESHLDKHHTSKLISNSQPAHMDNNNTKLELPGGQQALGTIDQEQIIFVTIA